jgi:hypothetical protein
LLGINQNGISDPFKIYLARWFRDNAEIRAGIKRGIVDIKAGKTVQWIQDA